MVAVDCETPMKMAMDIAKGASPDSTGKEILDRYRELVAQKSAERMKSLSLTNDNHSLLSSPSSCESSLGSMTSIDDQSDDFNHYTDDETNAMMEKRKRREQKRSTFSCKDNLTNAMVQEASMISNIVRGTIREKQLSKTPLKTPLKTPAKKKSSLAFNVFQDGGEERYNNSEAPRRGGSCIKPRSSTKRSALQPKSTNTQRPSTDTKLMMKKKKIASTIGGGVLKNATSTLQKSLIREEEESMKSCKINHTTKSSTSSTQMSSQKSKINVNQKEKMNSNAINTNLNSDTNNNNIVEQNEQPLKKVLEVSKERTVSKGSNENGRQSPSLKNNNVMESKGDSCAEGKSNHGDIEREDGELLSVGATPSTSMNCEVSNTVLHEDSLLNNFESSMNNRMKQASSGGENGNAIDDENTTTSSMATPNSVQTFSINGRSYSLDLSSNLLKNMFGSPTGGMSNGLSDGESLADRTMYNDVSMRSDNYLNDSVSPTSKVIATGSPDAIVANGGISRSSAASLIERNKTLIKEVRFADQTCVELSERNESMKRDMTRMEGQLSEMKKDNEALHNTIINTKEQRAVAEESCSGMRNMLTEQKGFFEARMRAMEQALTESKEQNQSLNEKLLLNDQRKMSTEKELVSLQAKYEALQETSVEAKEKVSTLMERLAATQSTAEVSAASAAESYREYCRKMENKIDRIEKLSEDRLEMFNIEKDARLKLERENDELMNKYSAMERTAESGGFSMTYSTLEESRTPGKMIVSEAESSKREEKTRTPTSSVLARTLEAELRRGYDATERIMEAEMIINVTQSELQESSRQLELSKAEIVRLNKKLEELSGQQTLSYSACKPSEPSIELDAFGNTSDADSSYDTCSTNELVGMALGQKLTHARNECEDYKRELESIVTHIKRLQGESFHSTTSQDGSNEQTIPGLLQAVRELAQVCAKQADEINELKLKGEEKKNKNKELECIIAEKKEKLSKQDGLMKELQTKIDNLSKLYSSQVVELNSTKSQMTTASQQFQKQLNQKMIEISNGEAKCNELVQKIAELSELCERQSEEISIMRSDIDKVNQNLIEKEQQLFSNNHRQECLMSEVVDVVERITHIKEQYKFQH